MTEHHPLTDTSRWTLLAGERVMTMAEVLAQAGMTMQDVVAQWDIHTCPMDGHLCGVPCCPLGSTREPNDSPE